MRQTLLLLSACFLICASPVLMAQDDPAAEKTNKYLIVKVDAANLLDVYPAIMISAEHPVKNFSLSHEIGRIYDVAPNGGDPTLDDISYQDINGWKIREEIRFYLRHVNKHENVYAGVVAHAGFFDIKTEDGIGHGCSNNRFSCEYYEQTEGIHSRTKFGLSMVVGVQTHDFKPLVFDFSFGLGVQHLYFNNRSLKALSTDEMFISGRQLPTFNRRTSDTLTPLAFISCRVGFKVF